MPRARARNIPTRSSRRVVKKRDEPMSAWEHLRKLLSKNFFDEAILLFEVTNLCEKNGVLYMPDNLNDLATYTELARSYYETFRYPQSETMFRNVLQHVPFPEKTSDDDPDLNVNSIKFQYLDCLIKMQKKVDAYALLNEMNADDCKDKVAKAIAEVLKMPAKPTLNLHRQPWRDNDFDEHGYRDCSSCIGSVQYIVRKNIRTYREFLSLPMDFIELFTGPEKHDIEMWFKAQEGIRSFNYLKAVECLKNMSHRNARVKTELAKVMYKLGRKDETRRLLKSAFIGDSCWIDGMDLFAFLSSRDESKYGPDLERLTTRLIEIWPDRPETQVASGYMARYFDLRSALAYGERAVDLSVPGTEQYAQACLLRSHCWVEVGRQAEAIDLLMQAIDHDRTNPELNLALADLFLDSEEYSEAGDLVTQLAARNPNDPHAQLLKIHVYINVNSRNNDRRSNQLLLETLEELVNTHPHLISSVATLLSEFYKFGKTEDCAELLECINKHKRYFPHNRSVIYHRINSDFNLKFLKPVHAYHHLVSALGLGSETPSSYLSEVEFELRTNGQEELNRRFPLSSPNDSSSEASTVRGSPSPSTPYNLRSRKVRPTTSQPSTSQPSTSRAHRAGSDQPGPNNSPNNPDIEPIVEQQHPLPFGELPIEPQRPRRRRRRRPSPNEMLRFVNEMQAQFLNFRQMVFVRGNAGQPGNPVNDAVAQLQAFAMQLPQPRPVEERENNSGESSGTEEAVNDEEAPDSGSDEGDALMAELIDGFQNEDR